MLISSLCMISLVDYVFVNLLQTNLKERHRTLAQSAYISAFNTASNLFFPLINSC
jgi:antibiotic biosynthesis monooxygenase (ABM) superfamily enzyme